ncbi:13662_t:CDS:2, partial [Acaulospora morrowiae]
MVEEELGETSFSTQDTSEGKAQNEEKQTEATQASKNSVSEQYNFGAARIDNSNEEMKTAHTIIALNRAINIAKKYLAGKIDTEYTVSQVNEWQETNIQTAELLSFKLTNKSQGINLVHWFQEIRNLKT